MRGERRGSDVAGTAEDYSLSITFAAKQVDTQPIFSVSFAFDRIAVIFFCLLLILHARLLAVFT